MTDQKKSKIKQQKEGTIQSPKETKRSEEWSAEEMEKAKPCPMPDPRKGQEKERKEDRSE